MNFVLVHGAWHGAWCWQRTRAELNALGHEVATPDLPGLGDDPEPPERVTLDDYARRVVEVLAAQPVPSVLVGHSMGGMAISAAAEQRPDLVQRLIYLCAFLPCDGDSLLALEERNEDPRVPPAVIPDKEHFTATLDPARIDDLFYHDCTAADAAAARARLRPQSFLPLTAPLRLSPGRYGRVPRAYLECLEDRAIVIAFQRRMQQRAPCDRVAALDSGHSPFLSMPRELARALVELALD